MHPPQARKQRVLLVDDEPEVLVALEDLLGDDFEVFKATSPHGALELLEREHDIAVVVTDQQMPKMTGEEFLATFPDKYTSQRIILTGYADIQAVIRAVNSGQLFAYVTKPWDPHDLHEKVERAARQFRLSRRLTNERELMHKLLDQNPDGIYFKDRELNFVEANRAFVHMVGVYDRSHRRTLAESEALLLKQTTLLHSILEGLSEGVVVTDEHGKFLVCNREAQRLLGSDPNALSVSNWVELCGLHDSDNKTPIAPGTDPLAQAMAGVALTKREVCLRSNGSFRARVGVSATPLRNERGEVIGGIGLLRDLQPHVAKPLARSEARPIGNGTILLVEDEDSVRRIAAAILRNQGYTVHEARRPSDAIQICARTQQPIDLLLTDVVMPESSGPQLAAELIGRHPHMSVMYMSGYSADNVLMGKALRDGITFLQKPFTPALLTEAVSEALTRPSVALQAS